MQMFYWGLALFFGVHLLPLVPPVRARLVGMMGENPYKGAFSLFSIGGIVLMSIGYPQGAPMLFVPPAWAPGLAPFIIFIAFVLFVAAQFPTHIRKAVRHPMSLGIIVWAGMHVFTSPNYTALWLFVLFALFAIVSVISAEQRGKGVGDIVPNIRMDALAIVLAGVAYAIAYYIHFT